MRAGLFSACLFVIGCSAGPKAPPEPPSPREGPSGNERSIPYDQLGRLIEPAMREQPWDREANVGYAIGASGRGVIVGAPGLKVGDALYAGGAFALHRQRSGQWVLESMLKHPSVMANQACGIAVAIANDRTLVACEQDRTVGVEYAGSVHVFRRNADAQWVHEATLAHPTPAGGDMFGRAVALDGDVALIGAPAYVTEEESPGSAHVFRRDPVSQKWRHEATLYEEPPTPRNGFGKAVALDGDVAVVGAEIGAFDHETLSRRSVHVFRRDPARDAWVHVQQLGAGSDRLGVSVAIHGAVIAAGARGEYSETTYFNDGDYNVEKKEGPGSVHVYERDAGNHRWFRVEILRSPVIRETDRFGENLAVYGRRILVRDREACFGGLLFQRAPDTQSWSLERALFHPDHTEPRGSFNGPVALIFDGAFVGGAGTGSPTFFPLPPGAPPP